ncbi:MAG: glycosyltransferase family 4 protein [Deltaproteobacteria bacterium]|nr:glycosyltransferase family 4 protein [Deltaproteobacteria bacterium]
MKVLHLTTHLNVGGITSYLYQLSQGLQKIGVQTSIASSGGEYSSEFESHQIPLHLIPLNTKSELNPKLALSFLKLKKLYQKEKWDLIHAHTRVGQCLAQALSSYCKIPYVTTFHGFYDHHLGRKLFPCLGQRTIANSHAVASNLKASYPNHEDQITTVLHGIDTDFFNSSAISNSQKEEERQKFNLSPLPTLGIIGRLSAEKGHVTLLEIFKILIEKYHQKIQLLIVGDGKQRESIEQKILELQLKEFVKLIPAQKDPRPFFGLMDVYVTYHVGPEGFGLSTLEAMAMGKPVVISYVQGGMSDFIEDEQEGFLMKGASPDTMAQKMNELLNSKSLQIKMGTNAAQKIKDHFSHQRMAEQTQKIYEQCF